MSSLFDIGRAGLQSYRRALSVTGQNIANVNTDGYKRRERLHATITDYSEETGCHTLQFHDRAEPLTVVLGGEETRFKIVKLKGGHQQLTRWLLFWDMAVLFCCVAPVVVPGTTRTTTGAPKLWAKTWTTTRARSRRTISWPTKQCMPSIWSAWETKWPSLASQHWGKDLPP